MWKKSKKNVQFFFRLGSGLAVLTEKTIFKNVFIFRDNESLLRPRGKNESPNTENDDSRKKK